MAEESTTPDSPRTDPDGPKPSVNQAWKQAPLSMALSTFAGIGHLPGGPGTYAALLFTPAIMAMSVWPRPWRIGPFAAVVAVSMWTAQRAGDALDEHDSRRIVIDEVVGVWMTLVWFEELGWLAALAGLVAFRALDIIKTPLAARIDDRGRGGVSVIADDLVAGAWAIPAVWLVRWLWP